MKRELTVLVKDELAKALQLKAQKDVMPLIDVTTITMDRITEALQINVYVTTGRKSKYQTGADLPFKDEVDPNIEREKEFKELIKTANKKTDLTKKQWEEKQKTLNEQQLKELRALREIVRVEPLRKQMNKLIKKITITNKELLKQFIELRQQEKEILTELELPLRNIIPPILNKFHKQIEQNNLTEELEKVKIELNL